MIAEITVKKNIIPAPVKPMSEKLKYKILGYEARIINSNDNLSEDDFELEHSFAEGLYIRRLIMPKEIFYVGKLHKDSYFAVMESGDMTCLTENGVKRLQGFHSSIAPPGTKRFGYTHEETIWKTVHANPDNITDIDELDKMIHVKEPCLNIEHFRFLTREMFYQEKAGFWSDWTKEQQKIYMSGDWEAFSVSRGYTGNEIAIVKEWIEIKELGDKIGINLLDYIQDLISVCVKKNSEADKDGEILLSSHIPTSKKTPYKRSIL